MCAGKAAVFVSDGAPQLWEEDAATAGGGSLQVTGELQKRYRTRTGLETKENREGRRRRKKGHGRRKIGGGREKRKWRKASKHNMLTPESQFAKLLYRRIWWNRQNLKVIFRGRTIPFLPTYKPFLLLTNVIKEMIETKKVGVKIKHLNVSYP